MILLLINYMLQAVDYLLTQHYVYDQLAATEKNPLLQSQDALIISKFIVCLVMFIFYKNKDKFKGYNKVMIGIAVFYTIFLILSCVSL